MHNNDNTSASRRAFLQRASALSVAGVAAPLALNMAAMAEASAANATDYKALVCVFMYGGNDYANTLVPYDTTSYNMYNSMRPSFAHARDTLAATLLTPTAVPVDLGGFTHQYALAPGLAALKPLFDAGKLGVVLNIGTMVEPVTKLQYTKRTARLPPKLFSHNDQQSMWQSSSPEGAISGWGGRLGDVFESSYGHSTFSCVNVSGNAVFLAGGSAVQYQVSTNGSVPVSGLKSNLFGSATATSALRTLMTQTRTHSLENEYNRIRKRSIDANEVLSGALTSMAPLTTVFPTANNLGDQLKLVARMIACAPTLGAKRQVFFVSIGGFDTHENVAGLHPVLMSKVGDAMAAFYKATVELGVADNVTQFTASDFGRTMQGNATGSDHGWGSMHFVLGGAVKGQRFFGTPPVVASNGVDDVGQGRLLPTTSVEQLAASLGSWMGVSDTDLLDMLPNLSNYNASARNLGVV